MSPAPCPLPPYDISEVMSGENYSQDLSKSQSECVWTKMWFELDARGKPGPKGRILGGDMQEQENGHGVTPLWNKSLAPLPPESHVWEAQFLLLVMIHTPPAAISCCPKVSIEMLHWFYLKPEPPHPNKGSRDAVNDHRWLRRSCSMWGLNRAIIFQILRLKHTKLLRFYQM